MVTWAELLCFFVMAMVLGALGVGLCRASDMGVEIEDLCALEMNDPTMTLNPPFS